jgi:hypothetical protein
VSTPERLGIEASGVGVASAELDELELGAGAGDVVLASAEQPARPARRIPAEAKPMVALVNVRMG